MTQIATMTAHPDTPEIVVIRTPPANSGELMAGFEPATYSAASKGYLMNIEHLSMLRRWLSRSGVHLVDERPRQTTGRPSTNRGPCPQHGYDPCPPGVPFGDWAGRHPEEARMLLDGLDAIKARSRDVKGRTP